MGIRLGLRFTQGHIRSDIIYERNVNPMPGTFTQVLCAGILASKLVRGSTILHREGLLVLCPPNCPVFLPYFNFLIPIPFQEPPS